MRNDGPGIALVAALAAATATATSAQEIPDNADLSSRVSAALPAFWDVLDFRLVASATQGDPVTPKALIRFEADVSPAVDLFNGTDQTAGPFKLLASTFPDEQDRTLYGTMELEYSSGSWSGSALIENPVDDLGQPIDFFTSPSLVQGSEKQKELAAMVRDNTVAEAMARMDAEIAGMMARHEKRMAGLRAAQAEEELNRAAEAERLADRHARALEDLEADYKDAVSSLEQEYEPAIAAEKERLKTELDDLAAAHAETVETLRGEQSAEISEINQDHEALMDALRTRHNEELGEIRARHQVEMAELEERFDILGESLARRISTSDEVIAAQDDLVARVQAISEGRQRIDAALEEAAVQRHIRVEELLGAWEGYATCRITEEPSMEIEECPSQVRTSSLNEPFSCRCDGETSGSIWGTDIYTADSATCAAAVHSGAIARSGGIVIVEGAPGQESYEASSRNGIQSSGYGSWDHSFRFVDEPERLREAGIDPETGEALKSEVSGTRPLIFEAETTFADGVRGRLSDLSREGAHNASVVATLFLPPPDAVEKEMRLVLDTTGPLASAREAQLERDEMARLTGRSPDEICESVVLAKQN